MEAVILAGGNRTRLLPMDTTVPKPLLPFFDRPVLEHTIKLLARHSISDIIITTSQLATDLVRYFGDGSRWGVKIRYSVETEPMGTAGAVRRVKDMITGPFMVVSGDVITDYDLTTALRMHANAGSIATILLHKAIDPTPFGVTECDECGRVTRFAEKPKSADAFAETVSTGIYILQPEVLSCIRHNSVQDFARNVFPLMLRNQELVYAFELPGYWCDIGEPLHYRNAHFDALQGKLAIDLPAVHAGEGIWVGDGVDIHPSAQLSSPIFIGSGAYIGPNAVIGEHTIIGANARIDEGAYVARSVIGGGAFIAPEITLVNSMVHGGFAVTQPETAPHSQPAHQPATKQVSELSPQEAIA